MSKNKELLVFAAKAAGICVEFYETHGSEICKKANDYGPNNLWDPLLDDGDALRLAVKLNLMVVCDTSTGMAQVAIPHHWLREPIGSDPYAATRRAIVCAAAEIGKGMK